MSPSPTQVLSFAVVSSHSSPAKQLVPNIIQTSSVPASPTGSTVANTLKPLDNKAV